MAGDVTGHAFAVPFRLWVAAAVNLRMHGMTDQKEANPAEKMLETPNLANALESDRFKKFLDHVPFAIAVSELHPSECIAYANLEFERLVGQSAADIHGQPWSGLLISAAATEGGRPLTDAIVDDQNDYIGVFTLGRGEVTKSVDAWSNIIEDDDGKPIFRLLALAEINDQRRAGAAELEQRVREKDTLLRELQHRVKNNLQMITALIRLESRNLSSTTTDERLARLAGRIESLALLYSLLAGEERSDSVDLGVYLSQLASAIMTAHATEGIRLNLKVDAWPVSLNVAMPTGLAVNELMTNSMKHAFVGRDGGTITLHSLVDDTGCKVVVADDGVGLADGIEWPNPGKLAALIVQSLKQNAGAHVTVESHRDNGMRVTIFFARADAAPEVP